MSNDNTEAKTKFECQHGYLINYFTNNNVGYITPSGRQQSKWSLCLGSKIFLTPSLRVQSGMLPVKWSKLHYIRKIKVREQREVTTSAANNES